MAKKVTNAQEPAAGEPETLGQDQPQAGGEPETAALVEGDGAAAAAAEAAGLFSQPDGAAAGVDRGPETGAETGQLPADAQTEQEIAGDGTAGDDAENGSDEPDRRGIDGDGGAVTLDPDGNPPSDQTPPDAANDSDGSADGEDFDHRILGAAHASFMALRSIFPDDDDEMMEGRAIPMAILGATAALVRKIGDRATLPVIAQELFLKGFRPKNTFRPWQEVAIDVFAHTLKRVDAYHQAEIDRQAREEAERNRPPPHHTPVADTLLAPGAGPLDRVF